MGESRSKRLKRQELDKRAVIKVNKTIKAVNEGVNGVVYFGAENDYPQTMELIIGGSSTAKSSASIYSKFLAGHGFTNEAINKIVVGKDPRGKDLTLLSLLRQSCDSASTNYGFYIHRNTNLNGVTGTVHLKPFKDMRFSKPDDRGFSAKVLYHQNWSKDKDLGRFKIGDSVVYPLFTNDPNAIASQVKAAGGPDRYKGQVYFCFLDNQYFYPLSPFDPVYLDADTEQQLALYKNRQLRNGFFDKILVRTQPGIETTDDKGETVKTEGIKDEIVEFLGADGETVMAFEDDIDPDTQEFYKNSFQIENIKGNVDNKLFQNWEKTVANSIRKSPRNIPAILIDYESSQLGATSGEAIVQATEFYNAMTDDDRTLISEAFEEIFKTSEIKELRENEDWSIKPLNLVNNGATT